MKIKRRSFIETALLIVALLVPAIFAGATLAQARTPAAKIIVDSGAPEDGFNVWG
jgi:hypothetical protein